MTTDQAPQCIHLHGWLGDDRCITLILDQYDEMRVLATTPGWNQAVHPVGDVTRGESALRGTIALRPDPWGPVPDPAPIAVEVSGGRWRGTWADQQLEGDVTRTAARRPISSTLEVTLVQCMATRRGDFRDLRLIVDRSTSAVQVVTFHQDLQGCMPLEVVEFNECDGRIAIGGTVHYPGADDVPARSFTIHVEADIIGDRALGAWSATGLDVHPSGVAQGQAVLQPETVPRMNHLGVLIGVEECQRIRDRLQRKLEPESHALTALRAQLADFESYRPDPQTTFVPATHHFSPGHCRTLKEDAAVAYGTSLVALLDGDCAAGQTTARILDAWSTTLTDIDLSDPGKPGYLYTCYLWPAMVWAADHLRQAGIAFDDDALTRLLREVVLPVCQPTLYRNNWTCWAICCHASIALYLDDPEEFGTACERYRDLLPEYIREDGSTKETLRDLVHTQMGLAPLCCTAEMAWHRGIDLYASDNERLLAGIELHAPWALGELEDWPYQKPAKDVGKVWPYYHLAKHHYHGRLGRPTPRIDRVLEAGDSEAFDRLGYFSLTHG